MKYTIYLSEEDVNNLEYEIVSTEIKAHLTRVLRTKLIEEFKTPEELLMKQNQLINASKQIRGREIYVLQADDFGAYQDYEVVWHQGEYELIFRSLDTIQFTEMIGELISNNWFEIEEINQLLQKDGLSFYFYYNQRTLAVRILTVDKIDEFIDTNAHPNIRVLVSRIDNALTNQDYGLLIHTTATIFETLAKDLIANPNIQDKTLKSFFDKYRKESKLSNEILDWIEKQYEARSTTPLAAHGQTAPPPNLSDAEAVTIAEMTKAFVRIGYQLAVRSATFST